MSDSTVRPLLRLGVLLGSARPTGNGVGIRAWLVAQLLRSIAEHPATSTPGHPSPAYEVVDIHSAATLLPPVTSDVIPAAVRNGDYPDPIIRAWSARVSACHAFLIITPQHNWGYPGELKTALDHLYHEWKGKPVAVVTYGGHGGGKAGQQLRQVLEGGLKMRVVAAELAVDLPHEHIQGGARLSTDVAKGTFLDAYEEAAAQLCEQLLLSTTRPQPPSKPHLPHDPAASTST